MSANGRRAMVTGLGVLAPVGIGNETAWENLVAGRSGIRDVTIADLSDQDIRVGGEVPDFDPNKEMDAKDVRRHDRATQMAVAASAEALRDAGLINGNSQILPEEANPDRIGMVFGSGCGGVSILLENAKRYWDVGANRVSPWTIPHMLVDSPSGMVAIQFGIRGPNTAVVSACATGSHAIGEAAETIIRGQADLMLGAGTEAALVPLAFAGFGQMRALGTPIDPDTGEYVPSIASRPFDATRNGFVIAEGCAVLVLEELEHALARGARPIAELVGYGSAADAFHMAAPPEHGEGSQRSMRWAMERGGIDPTEVDYINPHGTGTPLNDLAETQAIEAVFGDHARKLAISSTKSMTGHMMGAAGAFEGWASVKVLDTGWIPPTINLNHPDPALTLDYVPHVARQADVKVALSNSMGLGGHNGTIIFRKYEA
ncbi:MAG TPA: beta-ketoacyl-ACP synthase II [Candidatus Limnocylindria bacterium]